MAETAKVVIDLMVWMILAGLELIAPGTIDQQLIGQKLIVHKPIVRGRIGRDQIALKPIAPTRSDRSQIAPRRNVHNRTDRKRIGLRRTARKLTDRRRIAAKLIAHGLISLISRDRTSLSLTVHNLTVLRALRRGVKGIGLSRPGRRVQLTAVSSFLNGNKVGLQEPKARREDKILSNAAATSRHKLRNFRGTTARGLEAVNSREALVKALRVCRRIAAPLAAVAFLREGAERRRGIEVAVGIGVRIPTTRIRLQDIE